jgi:hypothetical protein
MEAIMTCKEVSTRIARAEMEGAPLMRRLALWLHLAMCRHCRVFQHQLVAMGRAARLLAHAFEREPSAVYERTVLDRLRS